MLFNKVSGGAEKVTIDGQKVNKKLDLETDFSMKELAFSGHLNIVPKYAIYNPLLKKYLVLDDYKKRAFLLSEANFNEEMKWKEISTPPPNSKFIFFKNEEVILINDENKFYKVDIEENGNAVYTNIGGSFPKEIFRFWYDEKTNELFGELRTGMIMKFDFNSDSWTEIATYEGVLSCVGVIRNKKIIWLGLPKNEKRKSVVEFDGKTFTEKVDVLNVEVALSPDTRAGILNGKIHVFSNVKINDVIISNGHVVETSEYKFKRLLGISGIVSNNTYGYNNCSDNNNKLALLCIGFDRELSIEIVEVYKEMEV